MTPVNSIEVPSEFVDLAGSWYDGQGDILYAVASTGNLITGTDRPYNDDEERPMTDEEWYVHLYSDLDVTLSRLVRQLKPYTRGRGALRRFQRWAERTEKRLRSEYGLD